MNKKDTSLDEIPLRDGLSNSLGIITCVLVLKLLHKNL
jgi:hypothetical protein